VLKWIERIVAAALLVALAAVGYRWASSRVALDIYRDRLERLGRDYESLRTMYNEAVRKTAVTELIVEGGRLTVAIRTAEGVGRVIETPFDPREEIYCDYVLARGRLWIRRVYDAKTPPHQGLVIDSTFADVDWTSPSARYGNAVYRSLEEGRWIVTVTGEGSLGLARAEDLDALPLSPPPTVKDYREMLEDIDKDVTKISVGQVLRRLVAGGPSSRQKGSDLD